jgi:hypothetical protein
MRSSARSRRALNVSNSASFVAFRKQVAAELAATCGRTDFDYLVNNAGYGLFNPICQRHGGRVRWPVRGPSQGAILPYTGVVVAGSRWRRHREHHQREDTRRYCGGGPLRRVQGWARGAYPLYGQGIRRPPDPCEHSVARPYPHRSGRRVERRVRGAASRAAWSSRRYRARLLAGLQRVVLRSR